MIVGLQGSVVLWVWCVCAACVLGDCGVMLRLAFYGARWCLMCCFVSVFCLFDC